MPSREQSNRLIYVAIGIAVIALIVAIVVGLRPTTQATTVTVKVTFTPAGPTLNITGWNWAKVGTLSVSGGDALVRFYIDGDVVSNTGYVRLINTGTGELIEGELGNWIAVKSGTYIVYIKALMRSFEGRLRVEAYA